jgi:hypothetical protein
MPLRWSLALVGGIGAINMTRLWRLGAGTRPIVILDDEKWVDIHQRAV